MTPHLRALFHGKWHSVSAASSAWIALPLFLLATSHVVFAQSDLEVEIEAELESVDESEPRVVLPFSGVPPYEDPAAAESRDDTTTEVMRQVAADENAGRERLRDFDDFRAAKQARRAHAVRQYALPDPPAGASQPPRPDEGDASAYAVRLQAALQRADGVAEEGNR